MIWLALPNKLFNEKARDRRFISQYYLWNKKKSSIDLCIQFLIYINMDIYCTLWVISQYYCHLFSYSNCFILAIASSFRLAPISYLFLTELHCLYPYLIFSEYLLEIWSFYKIRRRRRWCWRRRK